MSITHTILKDGVSFTFNDVELKQHEYFEQFKCQLETKLKDKSWYDKKTTEVIFNSHSEKNLLYPVCAHGMINTISTAYDDHIPLKFRPDDLWLSILVTFGKYVKTNSEKFRDKIVNHENVKDLIVYIGEGTRLEEVEKDFPKYIDMWLELINKNTKDNIVDWCNPTFTTTTEKDKVIASIALMSGFRKFFNYKGMPKCGLSKVTLLGTSEDWATLISKAEKLYYFEDDTLNAWADLLIPVLKEFKNAFDGEVKFDFWQRICASEPYGSHYASRRFRGWFMIFCPFGKTGDYILKSLEEVNSTHVYSNATDAEISDCEIDVDVEFEDMYNKKTYTLLGGVMATKYDKEENVLSPACEYLITSSKFLTLTEAKEIYLDILMECKDMHNPVLMENNLYDLITDFMCFVAKDTNIPNNILKNLGEVWYTMDLLMKNEEFVSNEHLLRRCYQKMAKWRSEFREYIKEDNEDNIITKFLAK